MKSKNFKNVITLILILCFVFGGSNVDQGAQGHRPLAFGWFTVSKFPTISKVWFVLETTKKKVLIKVQMSANGGVSF